LALGFDGAESAIESALDVRAWLSKKMTGAVNGRMRHVVRTVQHGACAATLPRVPSAASCV
jgi:hypothetical protein